MELAPFAHQEATRLLERLAFQVNAAVHSREPDAVHDLRVSIRRFTQALRTFGKCFPAPALKRIRKRLKPLMKLAGEVRNCDIAAQLISIQPENAALRNKVAERRRRSERSLVASLKRWTAQGNSAKWRAALSDGAATPHSKPVEELARQELPGRAKKFLRRGDQAADAGASAARLHRFRIASKKFRYTLELFESTLGPGVERWIKRTRKVQTALGEINDCRAARALLAELSAGAGVDSALKRRQQRKTREFQRLWREEFGSGSGRKRWLGELSRVPRKPMVRSARASSGAQADQGAGSTMMSM